MLYCPEKWDTLYTHFAIDRKTNIQHVLHALKNANYIQVSEDKDQIVRITPSGLRRLDRITWDTYLLASLIGFTPGFLVPF
jgi:hypothetical protein